VRTCDLCPEDQVDRELKDDDSDRESDWLNRTSHPIYHVKVPEPKKQPNRVTAHVPNGEVPNITRHMVPSVFVVNPDRRSDIQKLSAVGQSKDTFSGTYGHQNYDNLLRRQLEGPADPQVLFSLMFEEFEKFEECSEMEPSQVDALSDCVSVYSSECEVLPVPEIPRTIQVPGPAETLSVQSDEQLCLDSDNEQEKRASRLKEYNLLSKPKQLIDFDTQSFNSTTSTVDTDMNTLSVDSSSITSNNSEEFTGLADTHNIETMSVDVEVHTLDPKVETK
jgi:hypothetical protein